MMKTLSPSLAQQLLQPRAIAVVGASDDPTKTTARPQQFLKHAGFEGATYFINPRRETVQGAKAWPSLGALPETPDLVFIMTGAERAIEAVKECGEVGVPVAVVLASGFGEEGERGREREARLRETARRGGVRLIGPSSLGLVNPRNGLLLTGNAAFDEPDIPTGGIFVASQSGSVIGALVSRARGRGIGFAGLVSVGGEADLSVGEICQAVLDDPEITSFALFMETLSHSAELAAFARAADAAGKPVTVYKLGRSEAAAELSVSHTGALAGSDSEAEAFFKACGFARVENFEGLLETPAVLRRIPAATQQRDPRICVVTTTGGGAAIMVDQLAGHGLNVIRPSDELFARLAAAGVDVPHSLILDLGLDGARHEVVSMALKLLEDSGEYDLVVFTIGSSARLYPELAVRAIADAGQQRVPLIAFAVPEAPQAAELLHAAGVPAFRTPEACADAIAAAFARRPASIGEHFQVAQGTTSRVLDEQASTEVLRQAGVPLATSVALTVAEINAGTELPFAYPVVVKVLSDLVPHKSDAGGVLLNVGSAEELVDAVRRIVSNVHQTLPEVPVERVLVQPMAAPALGEALLGYRVSPDVGALVVLSTGGVLAELFDDSSVRLAPVTKEIALEMIAEVRGLASVRGYRNAPLGDLDALSNAIVALSRLAQTNPEVAEAEANPLLVYGQGQGVLALDALVRTTA
ncbi:acetate--CoA ligase family protein [Glutamicibacter uratoxydans]|uniref:acetate--CoA ligase family protein n=1 Tax=Glutamicibacter uratoxydans TaxID=43667 RepID=UPI003D6F5F56